jgi:hypothetical protein
MKGRRKTRNEQFARSIKHEIISLKKFFNNVFRGNFEANAFFQGGENAKLFSFQIVFLFADTNNASNSCWKRSIELEEKDEQEAAISGGIITSNSYSKDASISASDFFQY